MCEYLSVCLHLEFSAPYLGYTVHCIRSACIDPDGSKGKGQDDVHCRQLAWVCMSVGVLRFSGWLKCLIRTMHDGEVVIFFIFVIQETIRS